MFELLTKFQDENPKIWNNAKNRRAEYKGKSDEPVKKKQGKHTNPDELRLDDGKDMVPIVYDDSRRDIEPVHVRLQKNHEKIKQMHEANPGAHFGDLA